MGRIVIAVYRPKPGKAEELHALVREHLPILRKLGLATDRAPIAMKAADGTVLEVFEWRSEEAAKQAHSNPVVLEMWGRFGAACDMVRPVDVAEISQMFAHYEPLD